MQEGFRVSAPRYGVEWPDGTYTGAISDQQRLAASYARNHNGKAYEVGSASDPEKKGPTSASPRLGTQAGAGEQI